MSEMRELRPEAVEADELFVHQGEDRNKDSVVLVQMPNSDEEVEEFVGEDMVEESGVSEYGEYNMAELLDEIKRLKRELEYYGKRSSSPGLSASSIGSSPRLTPVPLIRTDKSIALSLNKGAASGNLLRLNTERSEMASAHGVSVRGSAHAISSVRNSNEKEELGELQEMLGRLEGEKAEMELAVAELERECGELKGEVEEKRKAIDRLMGELKEITDTNCSL